MTSMNATMCVLMGAVFGTTGQPDPVAKAALYDYLQEHPERCPGCSGTKRTYHDALGEDVTCWVCEAPEGHDEQVCPWCKERFRGTCCPDCGPDDLVCGR